MTWPEILLSNRLVGRHLSTIESGEECRGPIQSVLLINKQIRFRLSWLAAKQPDGSWVVYKKGALITCQTDFCRDSSPRLVDGEIYFDIPYIGEAVVLSERAENICPVFAASRAFVS